MSNTYQIQLGNKIGRINGRTCAVGNEWLVVHLASWCAVAKFDKREQAQAWIDAQVSK